MNQGVLKMKYIILILLVPILSSCAKEEFSMKTICMEGVELLLYGNRENFSLTTHFDKNGKVMLCDMKGKDAQPR